MMQRRLKKENPEFSFSDCLEVEVKKFFGKLETDSGSIGQAGKSIGKNSIRISKAAMIALTYSWRYIWC